MKDVVEGRGAVGRVGVRVATLKARRALVVARRVAARELLARGCAARARPLRRRQRAQHRLVTAVVQRPCEQLDADDAKRQEEKGE